MEFLRGGVVQYLTRRVYDWISTLDRGLDMRVLNYGFDDGCQIPLDPEDQPHRLRLALYHHVASAVDLENKDVLEIGSGRGGGASYMARHLHPRSVHGVDLSPKAIDFCQQFYSVPNLSFSKGNAEALDLENNSYDVAVNIESSHYYSNKGKFLSEVHRVLKPGGFFLFADMRPADQVEALRYLLEHSGMIMVREEDITSNVLLALDKDNDYKQAVIERSVPRFMQKPFSTFAGVKGTRFYNQLQSGDLSYFNLVLQKQLLSIESV